MTEIDRKYDQLGGLSGILGEPRTAEFSLHDGAGAFRDYDGGSIYWTPSTGAHFVAGAIRDKWMSLSGQDGFLGYPTSDEDFASDGRGRRSYFENGAIFWSPETGAHLVTGGIKLSWEQEQAEIGRLGYPLSDEADIAWGGGRYSLFERGAIYWTADAGVQVLPLITPQLGCPALVSLTPEVLNELQVVAPITSEALKAHARRESPTLVRQLWSGRLSLRPVGGGTNVALDAGQDVLRSDPLGESLTAQFQASQPLAERTLYDLCFTTPEGHTLVLAPHSVYAKSTWESAGLAHVTDVHVSRRIDTFARRLTELGLPEGAKNLNNHNERLRAFVRQANRLHEQSKLDLVFMTGDLVDYVFEDDDSRLGPGNYQLLEDIILGRSPSVSGETTEELSVPIFTTLGNHDYRENPYPIAFDLTVAGYGLKYVKSFGALNLTLREGVALAGGSWALPGPLDGSSPVLRLPELNADAAKKGLQVDPRMADGTASYFRRFNRKNSFTVKLGKHRIVMIDTGPDVGMTQGLRDAFVAVMGNGPEDKITFVGGSPNSRGVQASDLELLKVALDEAGESGLVLIGMHAPPINIASDENNYYFREAEHASSDWKETVGFLFRHKQGFFGDTFLTWNTDPKLFPDWTRNGVSYFKTGDPGNLLDEGVARGTTAELLQLCVGSNGRRKADLVLFGHVHRHVEFRVERSESGELRFYHDHYSDNPKEYYPSIASDNGDYRQKRTVRVFVDANVEPRNITRKVTDEAAGHFETEWRRAVPPNPMTLNSSSDATAWWKQHRPVFLQTAPIGPLDSNQRPDRDLEPGRNGRFDLTRRMPRPKPLFQGFRLLLVANNVLERIELCHTDRSR